MRARRTVIVFLKAPRLGQVKTRLAAAIGVIEATRFHRAMAASLIRRLGRDKRWRTVLCLAPRQGLRHRDIPGMGLPRVEQGRGDLGQRMARALRRCERRPAVLVGTDIPGLTPAVIARAFHLLARHDGVFGPAADGGFWLVGLRNRRPRFDGVRWSTRHALADTLAGLGRARIALLDKLEDIDTPADYRRWRSRSRQDALCSGRARVTVRP
ncbi:MAG: TIGR04282 family arsenosugar biosynthesis glycosyltransferase [Alphaproteobacteria bacterium]|nr:TIGR04282 family arsenosugar biosynthesis glycosyltransferase [Alphaproteobacteria bacterium]